MNVQFVAGRTVSNRLFLGSVIIANGWEKNLTLKLRFIYIKERYLSKKKKKEFRRKLLKRDLQKLYLLRYF